MKFLKSITLSALAAGFACTAALADDDKEKKPEKKHRDPAARFEKLDDNKDGMVTLDELKAGTKKHPEMAERIMKSKDKDNDSQLSKEEFTAEPSRKKGGKGKGKGKGKGEKKDGAE